MTVWFTDQSREYVCEETIDEVVLTIPQSDSLHVALETVPG